MTKTPEIPFSHGDLVTITGIGTKVVLWFKDFSGAIRGVTLDITNPTSPVMAKDEILIKRKTEGASRGRKLPPVGQPLR
jgi:hypothetical protein